MQKQSQFKQFKGNILIIDDSLTNLRTLSRILTEHGYAVRNAPSGSMGLDITQRYPPDLILLDIDMEGINGYEVCRQLKNDPQTQDIPVIFVSVLAAMENKVKGLVEGGVDYITKPYRVEEILARIQVHMTLRQLQKKLEVKNTLLRQEVAVRKQTETALKEAHDELKAQYRQAQKMETVGIMTGGIAHDFNNLLTVINGYAEMMQSHLPPDAPLRDMAEKISTSGQRAADLTRQLLSYSRKQDGQPQIIGLNEVVRNLENMLRRIIGEDIMIITDLTPGKCTAKIDPVEMEQVIVNLVINARDAMPTGGRLTITTSRVALAEGDDSAALNVSPGQYAALTVSDTGCGISETDKGHIFEPFFTTKDEGKGTGLGLATVQDIVEQNGGAITVKSKEGIGTTFTIFLPRTVEASSALPGSEIETSLPRGNEILLLVEDCDTVRSMCQRILNDQGYTVLAAPDGQKALQIAGNHVGPIDLLLADLVLPDASGSTLSKQLSETRPGLKCLFMSGHTEETIARHGVVASEVAFLQKPFNPANLACRVREVLNGGAAPQQDMEEDK